MGGQRVNKGKATRSRGSRANIKRKSRYGHDALWGNSTPTTRSSQPLVGWQKMCVLQPPTKIETEPENKMPRTAELFSMLRRWQYTSCMKRPVKAPPGWPTISTKSFFPPGKSRTCRNQNMVGPEGKPNNLGVCVCICVCFFHMAIKELTGKLPILLTCCWLKRKIKAER